MHRRNGRKNNGTLTQQTILPGERNRGKLPVAAFDWVYKDSERDSECKYTLLLFPGRNCIGNAPKEKLGGSQIDVALWDPSIANRHFEIEIPLAESYTDEEDAYLVLTTSSLTTLASAGVESVTGVNEECKYKELNIDRSSIILLNLEPHLHTYICPNSDVAARVVAELMENGNATSTALIQEHIQGARYCQPGREILLKPGKFIVCGKTYFRFRLLQEDMSVFTDEELISLSHLPQYQKKEKTDAVVVMQGSHSPEGTQQMHFKQLSEHRENSPVIKDSFLGDMLKLRARIPVVENMVNAHEEFDSTIPLTPILKYSEPVTNTGSSNYGKGVERDLTKMTRVISDMADLGETLVQEEVIEEENKPVEDSTTPLLTSEQARDQNEVQDHVPNRYKLLEALPFRLNGRDEGFNEEDASTQLINDATLVLNSDDNGATLKLDEDLDYDHDKTLVLNEDSDDTLSLSSDNTLLLESDDDATVIFNCEEDDVKVLSRDCIATKRFDQFSSSEQKMATVNSTLEIDSPSKHYPSKYNEASSHSEISEWASIESSGSYENLRSASMKGKYATHRALAMLDEIGTSISRSKTSSEIKKYDEDIDIPIPLTLNFPFVEGIDYPGFLEETQNELEAETKQHSGEEAATTSIIAHEEPSASEMIELGSKSNEVLTKSGDNGDGSKNSADLEEISEASESDIVPVRRSRNTRRKIVQDKDECEDDTIKNEISGEEIGKKRSLNSKVEEFDYLASTSSVTAPKRVRQIRASDNIGSKKKVEADKSKRVDRIMLTGISFNSDNFELSLDSVLKRIARIPNTELVSELPAVKASQKNFKPSERCGAFRVITAVLNSECLPFCEYLVTHEPKRTLKFLAALATARSIVHPSWLLDSLQNIDEDVSPTTTSRRRGKVQDSKLLPIDKFELESDRAISVSQLGGKSLKALIKQNRYWNRPTISNPNESIVKAETLGECWLTGYQIVLSPKSTGSCPLLPKCPSSLPDVGEASQTPPPWDNLCVVLQAHGADAIHVVAPSGTFSTDLELKITIKGKPNDTKETKIIVIATESELLDSSTVAALRFFVEKSLDVSPLSPVPIYQLDVLLSSCMKLEFDTSVDPLRESLWDIDSKGTYYPTKPFESKRAPTRRKRR